MASLDTAIAVVKLLGATNEEPVVTDEELNTILGLAVRPDESGYLVGDDLWTPTYNYYAAVSRVWEVKAAKISQKAINISSDGQTMGLAKQFDNCILMADRYRKRTGWTIEMQKEYIADEARTLGIYYVL